MFGFVFLSLLVMTVAVGAMLTLMFLNVAFAGPECTAGFPAGGSELIRGRFDGAALALRVEQAVSQVLTGLGMKPTVAGVCEAACHQREIRVTTPEVLAIVQELRQRQSPAQIEAIRTQARFGLEAQDGKFHCPLLMSGGFCACETARPLSCRTRCTAGADSPLEAQKLAESVGVGVTTVFRDCLQASGLDDKRYELNLALSKVLDDPLAADRWAHGEPILQPAPITSRA